MLRKRPDTVVLVSPASLSTFQWCERVADDRSRSADAFEHANGWCSSYARRRRWRRMGSANASRICV